VGSRQNLNGRLTQIVDELVTQGVTLEQARQEFERQFIVASLRSNDWNFCRSARSLGVHRNTLRNKVSHLGISTTEGRPRAFAGRRPLRRTLVGEGPPNNDTGVPRAGCADRAPSSEGRGPPPVQETS